MGQNGLMKKLPFLLLLLISTTLILASCSKAKRIERNLWNDGGQWNIEYYVETNNGNSTAFVDCGLFTFEEDGTGILILEVNGASQYQTFLYTVDNDRLSITQNDIATDYILDWDKDAVRFFTATQTFVLRKK